MRLLRSQGFGLPVALLLAAACATGRAGDGAGRSEEGYLVEVRNDLIPPTYVTVRVVSGAEGSRTLLGSVSPGQTRSFEFSGYALSGGYRLVAELSDGSDVVSRTFTLATMPPDTRLITWRLRSNSLDVP